MKLLSGKILILLTGLLSTACAQTLGTSTARIRWNVPGVDQQTVTFIVETFVTSVASAGVSGRFENTAITPTYFEASIVFEGMPQTSHEGLLTGYRLAATSSAGLIALISSSWAPGTGTGGGATATAPMITTQPNAQSVREGDRTTFSVVATGNPAPAFQWRQNGTPISGATAATLTFSASAGSAGSYTVVVTNSAGTVTSNAATLLVGPIIVAPPSITTQPISQSVTVGANVTFSVVASPAQFYQWRRNGTAIAGATAATLTLTNVTTAEAGVYSVVVTGGAGIATSRDATLTVGSVVTSTGPTISTQPTVRTVTIGASTTFSVVATGTPAPTYQWRKDGVALAGATASTLTLSNIVAASAGGYSVVVSNPVGAVTSGVASLAVTTPGAATSRVLLRDTFALNAAAGRNAGANLNGKPVETAASGTPLWTSNDLYQGGANTFVSAGYIAPSSGHNSALAGLPVTLEAGKIYYLKARFYPSTGNGIVPFLSLGFFRQTSGGFINTARVLDFVIFPTKYTLIANTSLLTSGTEYASFPSYPGGTPLPTRTSPATVEMTWDTSANTVTTKINGVTLSSSRSLDGTSARVGDVRYVGFGRDFNMDGNSVVDDFEFGEIATGAGNDSYAGATILGGSTGQISDTLAGATREAADPTSELASIPVLGSSVWYRWTAAASGAVTFRLSGATFQSFIAAFTGARLGALTRRAVNVTTGFVTFEAVAGTTYSIMVDRWRDTAGAFSLSWSQVVAAPAVAYLSNLSVLARAGTGDQTLAVGVTVGGGEGTKSILIRGIGPTLGSFGVTGALADPTMTVTRGTTRVATNDDWGNDNAITSVSNVVGAFALPASSRDAVINGTGYAAGGYVVELAGKNGATGTGLVEVYDTERNATITSASPRLTNVAARTFGGTGSSTLIVGFTVAGSGSMRVLVRASGPGLAPFGLTGLMPDPKLELYNGAGAKLSENDNWEAATLATQNSVGAFPLPANSRDSVLIATLTPGGYTAQVTAVGGATGVALVELYEIP